MKAKEIISDETVPEVPEVTSSGDVENVTLEPVYSYNESDLTILPKTVVMGKRGVHHGGHLLMRSDGSGVFKPTSYEGHLPHMQGTHDARGNIIFSSRDDLANKLP